MIDTYEVVENLPCKTGDCLLYNSRVPEEIHQEHGSMACSYLAAITASGEGTDLELGECPLVYWEARLTAEQAFEEEAGEQ